MPAYLPVFDSKTAHKLLLLLTCISALATFGCGAKNPQELQAQPAIHEEYTVNNNYQAVFKSINDKVLQCDNLKFYKETNLYNELGEGELHFYGDGRYSMLLVKVKKLPDSKSKVSVYTAFSNLSWPSYVETIRRGAYGEAGCP